VHTSDVIALVVLWRLRYKLALRDLPEMFAVRGIVFSHEAVREWEAKLTPALAEALRRRRRGKVGRSWYVDETYLKVHGRWCYLYRAIDRNGTLVDVLFSEHRDRAAAQAFFRSAKAVTGVTPDRVTTDGHDSYPRAIRTELGKGVRHRASAYLNSRLEQDRRGIKARYRPMRGFKCPRSAARFCRRGSSPVCSCPGADHAASGADRAASGQGVGHGKGPRSHSVWHPCAITSPASKNEAVSLLLPTLLSVSGVIGSAA
jgi:putative transposase